MRIAIVGIGCRYPGARSARELFENILAGRRAFRPVPPERWRLEDYYDPDRHRPDMTYVKKGAFIEGFDFNAAAYKITQRTYLTTDQAQWLALQTSQEALDDAHLKNLPNESTAVILGNTLTGETSRAFNVRFRWPYARRVFGELLDGLQLDEAGKQALLERVEARYKAPFPDVTEDTLAGGLANTIAGRVCNYFNLRGGGYTVDGACSSSLLAVIHAARGLCDGEFDLALAGGVDISLDPFEMVGFAKVGALSPDDIHVYDQSGSGFLPGEGCGVVVMKRLDDALADGDRIYATLAGWGVSSDGKGGLTAPNVDGQMLAMRRAYARAGYSLGDVRLIEGHGTGTGVGDDVELSAVTRSLAAAGVSDERRCGIGSIKSNIGHTKAAAGVAGLIKVALSVYHRILPPTQGISRPHRTFARNPQLYPLLRGAAWPGDEAARASVSSAGFGGINTHVTLEQGPAPGPADEQRALLRLLASAQDAEVVFVGARHGKGLLAQLDAISDAAARISQAELSDLAAACAGRIEPGPARLAVVASTPEELHARLAQARALLSQAGGGREIAYLSADEGLYLRSRPRPPRIAYAFPGQGSQRLNAGHAWRTRFGALERLWGEVDQDLADLLPRPLSSYVFRDVERAGEAAQQSFVRELTETSVAQVAIVAASMAMVELLRLLGIEGELALGHSLGEYSALWYAGALGRRETLRLVAARGRAMSASEDRAGAMLSVAETPDNVRALLSEVNGYVDIANYNGPRSTVVSGETVAVARVEELCAARSVGCTRLPVSNAFHSRLMEPARAALRPHLEAAPFQPLRLPVVSGVTGALLREDHDLRALLADQIVRPVLFEQAVQTCVEDAAVDAVVEVGPAAVLTRLLAKISPDALCFSTDPNPESSSMVGLMHLVAYVFASGLDVHTARLFEARCCRPLDLPYRPRFIASPCEAPVEPLVVEGVEARVAGPAAAGPREPSAVTHVTAPSNGRAAAKGSAIRPASPQQVFEIIEGYVSQQFGYPREMMNRDVKMAEDLSLDSIKTVEVVAAVMAKLGIKSDPSGLTALPLGRLSERLFALAGGEGGGGRTQPGATPDLPVERPAWVRAFEARLVPEELSGPVLDWADGPVLLAAEGSGPLVAGLREAITARGREVVELAPGQAHAGPWSGCVFIPSAATAAAELDDAAAVTGFERLFRTLQPLLSQSERPGRFVALLLHGGCAFNDGLPPQPAAGAGAGLVRTLALEHPTLETRVIDLAPCMAPGEAAEKVLAELRTAAGHVDAAHMPEGRFVRRYVPCLPQQLPHEPVALGQGDVVLVTGGAKGITARLALALARAKGVRLALVGRSAGDGDEVRRFLEECAAQAVEARYYAADVADPDSVARLLEEVGREQGPVAGLLHGAGANKLHRLAGGRVEEFLPVLAPKVRGLANLLRRLDPERLRWVGALSSVIADSGMIGNADYAFANEWMNLTLSRLRVQQPGLRVQSFGFSVWDEVGMGVRLGSVDGLKRMGIDAIQPEAGTALFVELVDRVWPRVGFVVAARPGSLRTLRFATAELPARRFVADVLDHQPGVALVSEVQLHPDVDTYLRDHDYDGSLLFPAVFGLEAMAQVAEAAARLPGAIPHGVPLIENAHFGRPIVVPESGRRIRVTALVTERAYLGTRVRVGVRSEVTNFEVDHFQAELVWSEAPAELPPPAVPHWAEALPLDPARELYGRILFQGPMFRNILSYHELSRTSCQARIAVPEGRSVPALENTLLGSPLVRDTFLHSIQLCVPEFRILPVSMERVFVARHSARVLYLSARERLREDRDFVYDVDVRDAEGHLVERLEGFRCRIIDKYTDTAVLQLLERIQSLSATRATGVRSAGDALTAGAEA
jgi:enediyne polyketide synthase